jgi:hypothetical protein
LVADNALVFTPSPVTTFAAGGQVFHFRSEGDETAFMVGDPAFKGFATLQGFSLANGDALDIAGLLSFTAPRRTPPISVITSAPGKAAVRRRFGSTRPAPATAVSSSPYCTMSPRPSLA